MRFRIINFEICRRFYKIANRQASLSSVNSYLLMYAPNHFKGRVSQVKKYRCLWNTNAPLPQHIKNRLDISQLTFDLDLWPTDLNIIRGHVLIKDYLPTEIEISGAKHSWVFSCRRCERQTWSLTLTFDLLTWILLGVMYSSRTIYLPSLKLLGQSVLELLVAQGVVDRHNLWPWPLTFWPEYQ